jgi:hypothetical protein
MSYYNEPSQSWQAPGRQQSWEQQPQQPPSRSGMHSSFGNSGPDMASNASPGASSTVNRDEAMAFASQFEGTYGP